MKIEFDSGTILLVGLISQGVFAAGILALKKENARANKFLALLALLLSLWLCDSFFRESGIYRQNPNFYFLPIYFSLGFGPLMYFYTKALSRKRFSLSPTDYLHFVPLFLQFCFYLYLQSRDYSYRRDFWFEVHKPFTYELELILSLASLLIYLIASRKLIATYKRQIENTYSNIHRITLNWLGSLHGILSLLALAWLLEALARLIWNFYPPTAFSAISIGLTLLLIAVGGILQKDLGAITDSLDHSETEVPAQKAEVPDPALLKRIQSIMTEKELFLKQELSLKEFASELGLPPRETSRAINLGMSMSFIDFVNQYRVQRFKQLSQNSSFEHLSLYGLALESGFNSKSTFNRVFRKLEGKSPSEYLKEAQNKQ